MNPQLAEKLKANLAKLRRSFGNKDENGEFISNFWKPKAGDQQIRIVPNYLLSSDANEEPIMLLYFYYNFGKTYLAPHQFDRPDFAFKMYLEMIKDTDPDVKAAAKNLRSTQRFFAPVLVRGKESEGVKFWGFGIKVYEMLKALYDNEEWGNISDLQNGVDLSITFTPSPDPDDQRQAKTVISPNRRSTPATTDPEIMEKIKNPPNLLELYTEPSAEELETAVKSYLGIGQPVQPDTAAEDFDPKKLGDAYPAPPADEMDDVEAAFNVIMNKGK